MGEDAKSYWDAVYRGSAATEVSWYETRPGKSLELINASRLHRHDAIIDVGGGTSFLAESLLNQGYDDLTVLDVSAVVLEKLRDRLGSNSGKVALLHQDVTAYHPARKYALWHDRAVFHFLDQDADRQRYVQALRHAVSPGGHVIIATFGPAGPRQCSGLPVARYEAVTLAAELGGEFELVESSLETHRTPRDDTQQFLYCRFHRRAP